MALTLKNMEYMERKGGKKRVGGAGATIITDQNIKNVVNAYFFDKKAVNECTNTFNVYLKSLNLMYKLKTTDLTVQNGDTRRVRLHVFSDEDNLKRKIRLHLL